MIFYDQTDSICAYIHFFFYKNAAYLSLRFKNKLRTMPALA